MNAQNVISTFATVDADGKVTAFDFANFDALVSELVTERAKIRKENASAIKEQKKADSAVLAQAGKEYYNTLKVGDIFKVVIGGEQVEVRKIETKSGSGASAACELVVSAGGKTDKRYPKFDKVVVPATSDEADAE